MIMHCLAEKGSRNTAIWVKRGSFEGTHVVQLVQYNEKHATQFTLLSGNEKFTKRAFHCNHCWQQKIF